MSDTFAKVDTILKRPTAWRIGKLTLFWPSPFPRGLISKTFFRIPLNVQDYCATVEPCCGEANPEPAALLKAALRQMIRRRSERWAIF